MRTLPAHHLPRPRLVASTTGQRVVVVEAGAGYGKSTLAVELVKAWGAVEVEVAFHEGGGDAGWFAAQLRYGILKAGFSGAAAAMVAAGEDPRQAVEAALVALDEGSFAFVLDDAHHAGREAAGLIDWMAHRLQHGQRLVVLARRLPDGALRLRRGEFLHLQAADLVLQTTETLELCRSGFSLETDAEAAAVLRAATGGWTAATVLAAARAVRTGETVEDVARAAARGHGQSSIVAILDEAISAFGPAELAALAQVARLVPTDKATIDMVGGTGFFDRALQVGTPLAPDGDGLWGLPGPVSDHLATLAPPDPAVLGFRGRGVRTAR